MTYYKNVTIFRIIMDKLKKKFSKLYDKYIGKIYRFVFFKVNSQEIAEDLCSEIFTRFWKNMQKGARFDNPQAFLYQIARNLVIDYYRQKSEPQISLADCKEITDQTVDIKEAVASRSELEQIKATLANISDDYREIITLHYIEDYSAAEISKILDRPEGTIRVMIHRGLEELKNQLNQQN